MDPLKVIVERIDLQLRSHLGQGVDGYRALNSARYARDMLLVCDAMTGTDLPLLAGQFRDASGPAARASQRRGPGRDPQSPQLWAAITSGFGVTPPPTHRARTARDSNKPWFSPNRWFGD